MSYNIILTSGKTCKNFVKGAHYDSRHQSFEPSDPEATVSENLASKVLHASITLHACGAIQWKHRLCWQSKIVLPTLLQYA